MAEIKIIVTRWYPEKQLLVTQMSGDMEEKDIERWENSLRNTLGLIENNSVFKVFVNTNGFNAINLDVQKKYRSVIPRTLAAYDWRVGYIELLEDEAEKMIYGNTRGIKCGGAAHCHHDETKMTIYQDHFGTERERYFADPDLASQWIENLAI